jgi:hypothetical protein
MKPQITISIPSPCHENWDAMTPETQGRFCSSCAKTVIDFTQMTDQQIVKTIENATDNICGRVQTTQLQRKLVVHQSPLWQQPKFFKYAAAAVLMFTLSMPEGKGQTEIINLKPKTDLTLIKNPHLQKINQIKPPEEMLLKGRVGGISSITYNNKEQKVNEKLLERFVKIIDKVTNEVVPWASVTTAQKGVSIEFISLGFYKVISKTTIPPIVSINADWFKRDNILLEEETNIVSIYKERDNNPTGWAIFIKYDINHFGKTNISIDLKESKTKNPIENATVKITKLDETQKIVSNKTYTSSQLLLENIKGDGKFNITISAPNYYDSSFVIDKADFKKGNFTLPFFLKPNEDIVVIGYTSQKKVSCTFTTGIVKITSKETINSKLKITKQAKLETGKEKINNNKIDIFPSFVHPLEAITIKLTTDKVEPMMLALISQDGKYLQTQKIQTVIGQQTIPFTIAQNVTPQMAFVKLMNAKGQWVATEKLIIQ